VSGYRIEFAPAATRQLGSLPRKQKVRIASKIDALSSDPRPPGCVKLRGSEDIYRIRVGDYRILYQVKDDILLVLVVKVAHRGEAYKIRK
jgi:mRNA interferase RelE/StbE